VTTLEIGYLELKRFGATLIWNLRRRRLVRGNDECVQNEYAAIFPKNLQGSIKRILISNEFYVLVIIQPAFSLACEAMSHSCPSNRFPPIAVDSLESGGFHISKKLITVTNSSSAY